MPARFSEVVPDVLYRGGSPEPWEIKVLKDVYGIQQIISLDKESASRIHDACKENGVQHIVISIEDGVNDKAHLIKELGAKAIVGDLNSYVHCYHGKDRTGLFVAKYRIEDGWSFEDAMKEADSFGFGSGMDPEVVNNYVKVISENEKIDFPKQEQKELRDRINSGDPIYTTRISKEYNKYKPEMILEAPWNQLLRVVSVKKVNNIKEHPFINELTASQKKELSGNKMDIIKLEPCNKDKGKDLCESCGMLKERKICKTCEYVGVALGKLKNAGSIVDESREEPSCYHGIDDSSDNRGVSDMLNVPEERVDTVTASYFRQNIIKYLMRKEILRSADDQARITFKVPNSEKEKAKIAMRELEQLSEVTLRSFVDHLDLMHEPFKKYKGITPEQATDVSIHIDNFASVVEENLTKIKKKIFVIIRAIEEFDSDTTIYSMLSALDDSVNTIDTSVTNFVDILSNKESHDFQENAVSAIEIIKKNIAQLKQLTIETISAYLKDNIILENWTTEIEKEIAEEEAEQK